VSQLLILRISVESGIHWLNTSAMLRAELRRWRNSSALTNWLTG